MERLRAGGRVLLPLGMENGAPLGDALSQLQRFFERGIRYITLAHSASNRLADSSYGLERPLGGRAARGVGAGARSGSWRWLPRCRGRQR